MKKRKVPQPTPDEAGETTNEGLHRREMGPEKPKAGNIDIPGGRPKK